MAELTYIASALLTGLFLVGLVAALTRNRRWRSYAGDAGMSDVDTYATLRRMAGTPLAWTVAFLVLASVVGSGALAFVTGGLPSGVSQGAGVAMAAVALSALCVYLFWGVYHSARYRGLKDAQAAAVGMWVFGTLLIVAIVLRLLTAA